MPRKYDMSKRERAREETRRRIVAATAKLHGERGVFGTSWRDIAAEADVSVATVYAHFPSLDTLLPACGALVMERVQPPALDGAPDVIGNAVGVEERVRLVAEELFAFYDRGGVYIEVDVRERSLPGMREFEDYLLELAASRARVALAPARAGAHALRVVSALLDLQTYKALRARGVGKGRAAATVAGLAAALVSGAGCGEGDERAKVKR